MEFEDADRAARVGMGLAFVASRVPRRRALHSPRGDLSFAELNARANRLARALRRRGLGVEDGVALVCGNRNEFAETVFASQRSGLRLTPVNWHLRPEEVAYIVADSGARALIVEARFAEAAQAAAQAPALRARLALDGGMPGFEGYDSALGREAPGDLPDPVLGDTMLYTSGTTGRPKGVRRGRAAPEQAVAGWKLLQAVFGFRPEEGDVTLATGPLYHSGPLNLCLAIPLGSGIPVVLMEKWDAEEMLRLVERHRVTHTFCVPTMFHRLLQLPEETRRRHDLSSLRFVIHGAAPCPVEEKRAMIDWLGPILTEIFAATEGPGTLVGSEEWLKRPGTVGRPAPGSVRVLDEAGVPLPPGEPGILYLRAPEGARFEYHGAAEKTAAAQRGGFYTVGDVGYLDEDGYLFLTGRSAEVIISGGVNIYPAEIDDVLLAHPEVEDAAAVGVPDPEWGEAVRAVVCPRDATAAGAELAEVILAHCREHLPRFKVPRSVDFVEEVPRSDAGKVYRGRLRDRYREPGA